MDMDEWLGLELESYVLGAGKLACAYGYNHCNVFILMFLSVCVI